MSVLSPDRFVPETPSRGALQAFLCRLGAALAILLVIASLTLFGLILAERGREGVPARPLDAGAQALKQTAAYVVDHPAMYRWHRQDVPALGLVLTLLSRSAGLLLLSLGIAALVGVPVGIAVARLRRLRAAPLVLLLSVLGISTSSFLLAMLFWLANVRCIGGWGLNPRRCCPRALAGMRIWSCQPWCWRCARSRRLSRSPTFPCPMC